MALDNSERQPLVVDLSAQVIESTDELWDLLAVPCGLPTWFGRNLDAWVDTLRGGISEVIDEHPVLIIRVRPPGDQVPRSSYRYTILEIVTLDVTVPAR